MPTPFIHDVLLSHHRSDRGQVLRLAERLRGAGLRVAIEEGLEKSRTLVLCLSPAIVSSGWVAVERSTAPFRDPDHPNRRFLPLLLANCEVPDSLRGFEPIDYRGEDEAAFEKLLAACRRKASAAPPSAGARSVGARPASPAEGEPIAVLERKLEGHEDWVRCLAVSPDGNWAVSGSQDNTLMIWDLATGKRRATLMGHSAGVQSVKIISKRARIISAAYDRNIRVWEPQKNKKSAVLRGHTGPVLCIAKFKSDSKLISGSLDSSLRIWDIETSSCQNTIDMSPAPITSIDVAESIGVCVFGDIEGFLNLLDLDSGTLLARFHAHAGRIRAVQITPDEKRVVTSGQDKTIKIWDINNISCVGVFEGHQGKIYSVGISPNGVNLVSVGLQDRTLRIWDISSGECLQIIETEDHSAFVSTAFSPDGSRLLCGTTNPHFAIYIYRFKAAHTGPATTPTRRYTNAKVVLLGESGVGKSGLAHRLIEDRFVETHSTHGMRVWRLDLPLEDEDGLEREALLWDLAGQEDYRLVHQLFLDETALALVLVNPQKDDPFSEAVDWLKALGAAVGGGTPRREAARLLIAARTDVGTVRVSRQKIDRFLDKHGFAGYLPTSAKTGDGCADLMELIARHIPWKTLPWTSTPRLLAELKNAVLALAEEGEVQLLRFPELLQRLRHALPEERFGESDVRTAVTLLHNHGLVMPLAFGDLVLLTPQILNGYASAVIRAARAHVDEIGCVPERDVFERTLDWTGVDRLASADEQLLLRAMVQTFLDRSLCIAEETPEGRQLIFPSQYRRERPIPAHPEIFVSYTFTGELATIYTTLVVRLWYSREFDNKELWANAAELTTRAC